MGNLATPEFLIARWDELCRDPSLQDLPYKIELNAWGKIEMSPANNRHARLQGELAFDGDLESGLAFYQRGLAQRIEDREHAASAAAQSGPSSRSATRATAAATARRPTAAAPCSRPG